MRLFTAILVLLTGVLSQAAPADRSGDLGVGVMVGDTTSITGKYWTRPAAAFDLAGGGSSDKEGFIQASYSHHFLTMLNRDRAARVMTEMAPYLGFGLGVGFNRTIDNEKFQNDWYARVPIGVSWLPNRTPVDLFLEAAPTLVVSPEAVVSLEGNVGARYYF